MFEPSNNSGSLLSHGPGLEHHKTLGLGGDYRGDLFADEDFYLFATESGVGLVITDGTRIHLIDDDCAIALERASRSGQRQEITRLFQALGLRTERVIDDAPPVEIPVRALSLAVAQKCNLGCTYCYASGGDFGRPAKNMSEETAKRSIDRLLEGTVPGDRINLAFLGGEPLINRTVIVSATKYAAEHAAQHGVKIGFSITTNGTLVSLEDGQFFEHYGFAVTVSLDGIAGDHDALRPFKSSRGSFEHILARLDPLLGTQRNMQISARVTVTPRNLNLRQTLDQLVSMGFHSVGFSPMVSAPSGRDQMDAHDFSRMLDEMIDCGMEFEHRTIRGERYPFSNIESALHEIHRGTHKPYSCGAGAGYLGVSADGDLAACHRFVEDDVGQMGSIKAGVDKAAQERWLRERHVHRHSPCNRCWARYMCGGGCHHEVIHRGRIGCDYIRGWLHYTLQAYIRLVRVRPDFFQPELVAPHAVGAL